MVRLLPLIALVGLTLVGCTMPPPPGPVCGVYPGQSEQEFLRCGCQYNLLNEPMRALMKDTSSVYGSFRVYACTAPNNGGRQSMVYVRNGMVESVVKK